LHERRRYDVVRSRSASVARPRCGWCVR
jgi:hypothetical protein